MSHVVACHNRRCCAWLTCVSSREHEEYDETDDDEDEVYCDVDNDPNVIRKVYELEGQDMDEDDDESMADHDDNDDSPGMALKPDGWSDGREDEVEQLPSV